jgi:hypothetical protein
VVPLSEHTNCGECSHQCNCTYAGSSTPGNGTPRNGATGNGTH